MSWYITEDFSSEKESKAIPDVLDDDEEVTLDKLKEGLTPEQQELLESIVDYDGSEEDELEQSLNDNDFIIFDPETGEEIKCDNDFDSGLVNPKHMAKLELESFGNHQLQHYRSTINERLREIRQTLKRIHDKGTVNKQDALDADTLLYNTLRDRVILESFTRIDSKTNYRLIMEEIATKENAIVAAGAVVGLAILYKFLKWLLSGWGDNDSAMGSIGKHSSSVNDSINRVKNLDDVVVKSIETLREVKKRGGAAKSLADDKDAKLDQNKSKEVSEHNKRLQKYAESLPDDDKGVLDYWFANNVLKKPTMGYLFLSFISRRELTCTIGGVNTKFEFWKMFKENGEGSLGHAISVSLGIIDICKNVLDEIETIDDTTKLNVDQTPFQNLAKAINSLAKNCGYTSKEASANPEGFRTFIGQLTDSKFVIEQGFIKIDEIQPIDHQLITTILGQVDTDTQKDAEEMLKKVEKLKGGRNSPNSKNRLTTGSEQHQRDKVDAFDLAVKGFEMACNVLYIALTIRNNLGGGIALLDAQFKELTKGGNLENNAMNAAKQST